MSTAALLGIVLLPTTYSFFVPDGAKKGDHGGINDAFRPSHGSGNFYQGLFHGQAAKRLTLIVDEHCHH